MPHDAFISYSSKDKATADAACAYLEARGVRCWIAPRDIGAGQDWGAAIIDAIAASRVMVLLLSSGANGSPQVAREVERAVHKGVVLVPFRLENIPPSKSLEYFISTSHWLDALTPPLEAHLAKLTATVKRIIGDEGEAGGGGGAVPTAGKLDYPAAPVGAPRRRAELLVLVIAGVLVVIAGLFALNAVARKARTPVVTTPATRPAAAVATSPTLPARPVATRDGLSATEAGDAAAVVADLNRLDARLDQALRYVAARQQQAAGAKPATAPPSTDGADLSGDAEALTEFSSSGPLRLDYYWNVDQRVFALGPRAGEVGPLLREFNRRLSALRDDGTAFAAACDAADLRRRLAAAAADNKLARFAAGDQSESQLVERSLARAADLLRTHYALAHLAGLRLAAAMRTDPSYDAATELAGLRHLRPTRIAPPAELDAAEAELRKQEAPLLVAKREEQAEDDRLKAAIVARLAAGIPAAQRPAPNDSEDQLIAKARALRRAGQPDAAVAALACYAELCAATRSYAEDYYRAAARLARQQPSPFGGDAATSGGLFIYETEGHRATTSDGLAVGHVVVSVDGKPVAEVDDLRRILKDVPRGEPVRVEVLVPDGATGQYRRIPAKLSDGTLQASVMPI